MYMVLYIERYIVCIYIYIYIYIYIARYDDIYHRARTTGAPAVRRSTRRPARVSTRRRIFR